MIPLPPLNWSTIVGSHREPLVRHGIQREIATVVTRCSPTSLTRKGRSRSAHVWPLEEVARRLGVGGGA